MAALWRRTAARVPDRDEHETFQAVAREVLHAFDVILMPRVYGHTPAEGGRIALGHLKAGRELMQPAIDRYVAGARTAAGRARRRRKAARSVYVHAFTEALAHAAARADGTATSSAWPILYTRGYLPLIDQYTGDRRILRDAENRTDTHDPR